ncbi:MAG TPA: YdeI/OmpD-associated family protein [Tepidisphaeraceae bacterium]|nr:YdeI/OmpD-associated family protein [Tepidisphaeraceae bacterium]
MIGKHQAGSRGVGQSASPSSIHFSATLLRPKAIGRAKAVSWNFLNLPDEASDEFPSRGMVSVEGTLNGLPIRVTLQPDGQGGHWLKVDRKLIEGAGAATGDIVQLEITPVAEEPEPSVPSDLRKALAATPKARNAWSDITPVARRDWIQWITSGKRAETRKLRLDKACDMLAKGKRRPCCFDRSGLYSKSLNCPVAEDEPSGALRKNGNPSGNADARPKPRRTASRLDDGISAFL